MHSKLQNRIHTTRALHTIVDCIKANTACTTTSRMDKINTRRWVGTVFRWLTDWTNAGIVVSEKAYKLTWQDEEGEDYVDEEDDEEGEDYVDDEDDDDDEDYEDDENDDEDDDDEDYEHYVDEDNVNDDDDEEDSDEDYVDNEDDDTTKHSSTNPSSPTLALHVHSSTNDDVVYDVDALNCTCTCSDFVYRRKADSHSTCKHLRQVLASLYWLAYTNKQLPKDENGYRMLPLVGV